MKILKFRIKDYKSIEDSGDCYLTDTISILAGKNESGKTSILEALEDFDTDREIRNEAKPINRPDAIPMISITFEIEKDVVNGILDRIGEGKIKSKKSQIEVIKEYPDIYDLSPPSKEELGLSDHSKIRAANNELKNMWDNISSIHDKVPQLGAKMFAFNVDEYDTLSSAITTFKTKITPNIAHIADETERAKFTAELDNMITKIEEIRSFEESSSQFLKILKDETIPYFILFNTFEDVFPNVIPFTELKSSEWIKDLSVVSDLDVTTITDGNARNKHEHKTDVNITLNDDYKNFWTQDVSNLSIDWDSENLYFWVQEDGFTYEPSLRSKGRQWHLGFYIKISARAKENVPNIILIDEPGLFLHAKAQKDILVKLEDAGKSAQIIFSTHSPYLLEAKHLDRIRLIYRNKKEGTKIANKVHALADKETLTPILTAIGLELSAGIANIDKAKNVVVEGASDFYYLHAFKILLKDDEINFVFGGGAGNMPIVGTILNGWGCETAYLFDNDQGRKDGGKNLKKNRRCPTGHWRRQSGDAENSAEVRN